MIPSPRKPKVSLLGWMSFSLRVWLEVTRSIPVLGLAGLASVGLSSKPQYMNILSLFYPISNITQIT